MCDFKDPLVPLPFEKWCLLETLLKKNWPRSIAEYHLVETQRRLWDEGLYYGSKIFCPFGDFNNGIVILNEKEGLYEIAIASPNEDTGVLADALIKTKSIDWSKRIDLAFAPKIIFDCVYEVLPNVGTTFDETMILNLWLLDKESKLFEKVSLPANTNLGPVRLSDVDLVDATWPHRYPGSKWYQELLIKSNNSLGLYRKDQLISWIFIKENGALGHLYTIEEERRKGYGELMVKLISNQLLREKKDVFMYSLENNVVALKLYKKLGFENRGFVYYSYIENKK